ncbi:MAG TPA: response regulator [bacterium]|nr:response regulator [bacterium]
MSQKILLVDDAEETLFLMHQVLEKEGYTILEARDGAEALKKIETESPDLVLLDLILPRIDGFAVALQLKKSALPRKPLVIISTGHGRLRDLFLLREITHFSDYLEKPYTVKTLLEKVRNVLGEKHES